MSPALPSESIPFGQRLTRAVQAKRSAVCVGLDPRWSSLPDSLRTPGDSPELQSAALRTFCCEVIDAVADKVAIVKPQAAFFELFGPAGMQVLGEVIRYAIKRDLIVILDGKRNDIGTTAEAYANAYLGRGSLSPWGCDSLTVSPYLGDDSLEPFIQTCDARQAGIFVLVKTSNPGGGFLQDRVTDGKTIYRRVADYVAEANRQRVTDAGFGPIGAVVGATYREQLGELRQAMPHTWLLVPGYGAQGGAAADVAGAFDTQGLGAVINNSRQVIFAYQRKEFVGRFEPGRWQEAVALAVDEMNEELRSETAMGRLG